MNIIMAKEAGYCAGITRAMDLVDSLIDKGDGRRIAMLGDLSHNKQEMQRLYAAGVRKVDTVDEAEDGYLIIRTHGVTEKEIERAEQKGLTVLDATCPFVKAMHRKIQKYDELGYQIIIVGDKNHPEVLGASGWARNRAPIVLDDIRQADSIEGYDKLCVVSQTTLVEEKFNRIAEALRKKSRDILIFNTICHATSQRQQAAAQLAECVDGMIVVGGYHSSNTQKLKEVCEAHCKNTWQIETAEELDMEALRGLKTIGVTAGASTPGWIIEEVTETMGEYMFEEETVVTEEMENAPEATEGVEEETVVEETPEEVTVAQEEEAQPVESEEQAVEEEEVVQRTPEENSALDEEIDFAAEIDNIKPIRKGQNVEGEVILVSDDEVILNIGYKSDAVIHKRDFTWKHDEDLNDLVKVGDKVTATVVEFNDGDGRVKLSKTRYDNRLVQQRLKKAYDTKEILYGTITKVSKDGKGLMVDVGFTEIFMPASQYSRYVKNLESLIGKDVRGVIIDLNFDRNRRRAIFSQKRLSDERREQLQKLRESRYEEIQVGDVIEGTVKTIKDFGIFVDLNGIDGFIHRSDLTWDRDNDPFKIVKEGDVIQAKVIGRSRTSDQPKPQETESAEGQEGERPPKRPPRRNRDEMKIKLSIKDLQEKPWDKFRKRFFNNDEIEVIITNTMSFGAFAEILKGVEGLIHISEISYDRVEKVSDVLKPGDKVTVKIINIDEDNQRISLSMKALQEKPANYVPRDNNWSGNRNESRGGRRNNDRRGNRRNEGGGRNNRRGSQRNEAPIFYNDSESSGFGTIGDSFGSVLGTLNFQEPIIPESDEVEVVETPQPETVAVETETVESSEE